MQIAPHPEGVEPEKVHQSENVPEPKSWWLDSEPIEALRGLRWMVVGFHEGAVLLVSDKRHRVQRALDEFTAKWLPDKPPVIRDRYVPIYTWRRFFNGLFATCPVCDLLNPVDTTNLDVVGASLTPVECQHCNSSYHFRLDEFNAQPKQPEPEVATSEAEIYIPSVIDATLP